MLPQKREGRNQQNAKKTERKKMVSPTTDDAAAEKKEAPFFSVFFFAYALRFGPETAAGPKPESMLGLGAGGRGGRASERGEKECGKKGGECVVDGDVEEEEEEEKPDSTLPSLLVSRSLSCCCCGSRARAPVAVDEKP